MDVGDAEDVGDDGVGLAVGELLDDDAFGDAIEDDDRCRDKEREATLIAVARRGDRGCGFVGGLVR